jgi:hypothetical protein
VRRLAYVLCGFFAFISFSLPHVRKHKADGTTLHGRLGVPFSLEAHTSLLENEIVAAGTLNGPCRRFLTLED